MDSGMDKRGANGSRAGYQALLAHEYQLDGVGLKYLPLFIPLSKYKNLCTYPLYGRLGQELTGTPSAKTAGC